MVGQNLGSHPNIFIESLVHNLKTTKKVNPTIHTYEKYLVEFEILMVQNKGGLISEGILTLVQLPEKFSPEQKI